MGSVRARAPAIRTGDYRVDPGGYIEDRELLSNDVLNNFIHFSDWLYDHFMTSKLMRNTARTINGVSLVIR